MDKQKVKRRGPNYETFGKRSSPLSKRTDSENDIEVIVGDIVSNIPKPGSDDDLIQYYSDNADEKVIIARELRDMEA